MKKVIPYILYGIVILIVAILPVYQGLMSNTLESGNLVKGLLIIAVAVVGLGYFCPDSRDSSAEHLVFNRSVSLKDSFKPGK